MLPSTCTTVIFKLKSNQQTTMFSLAFSTKFAQYLCVDRGEVPSETLYDSSTELLLVFNCPMPQGLLGARWAGLNLFSRVMRRG